MSMIELRNICESLVRCEIQAIHDAEQALERFEQLTTPQMVLGLLNDERGYQQGAQIEAHAADEARKEVKRLKGVLHMMVTQAMPLEDIPDLPGYSRVVDAERLVAENKILRTFSNEMLGCVFDGGALDGGDIAIIGARCGVLTVRDVEEPCGEVCACAEYGFPGECYRKTDVMKGATYHG